MTAAALFLREAILFAPEILMAIGILAILTAALFLPPAQRNQFAAPAAMGLLAVIILLLLILPGERFEIFYGSFVTDNFAKVFKVLALGGSLAALAAAFAVRQPERLEDFEYPLLLLLAALGMMIMLSAHDLIAVYIGLELQSLALYVLAAFRRDSRRSSEAGLKYFALGALASGLLLYGCSLVYGFTGTLTFATLAEMETLGAGARVGMVFILAGIAFKLSAVPFHMWTPDVYEGAPAPVVLFFAAAPKVAAAGLLARLLLEAFPSLTTDWQQILFLLSAGSMLLGAVAAIAQTNIKRLLAYSSIGHVGYALIGLTAANPAGVSALALYMMIYMASAIGAFASILVLRRNGVICENISDFAGLAQRAPRLAFVLAALMLSMAGIPPLAGFFAKLYIFLAAIEAGLIALVIIAVIASAIGAYYYLRVIKIMYFDPPSEEALEYFEPLPLRLLILGAGGFVLVFVLVPRLLTEPAALAAAALLRP